MPHRSYASTANYRFGFNGKENDNEPKGLGNEQDYGMRIYDNRLGKFLSVDPLQKKFPWLSPYVFAENDVIRSLDFDGLEKIYHYEVSKDNKPVLKNVEELGPLSGANYTLTFGGKKFESNTYYPWDIPSGISTVERATLSLFLLGGYDRSSTRVASSIEELNYNLDEYVNFYQSLILAYRENSLENRANQFLGASAFFMMELHSTIKPTSGAQAGNSNNKQITRLNSGNNSAAELNTEAPSPTQSISLKNFTSPKGPSGSVNFTLKNGLINLTNRSVTNGTFDFVVTNEGKLVIGSKHYSLSSGSSEVQAAGQLRIYKGKVMEINNNSGHYLPSEKEAENFGIILKKAGVDVSGAKLNVLNKNGVKVKTIVQ